MLEGKLLKEEQFKVLKTLSEATNRMDLNMLAEKVNLNPNQTMQQVQELAKEGFLQRVGGGYGMTEKGKAALRVFAQVPKDMGFHFCHGVDRPTDFTAQSLEEFYRLVNQVSVDSLEFHLYRGDFENWLKEAVKDPDFADKIAGAKAVGLKGEDLRAQLLKMLDSKYTFKN
jgi:predicted transcriptional regulator